ncbi:MAG: hypothetical protein ACXVWW_11470 [Nocardioides sp.]
MRGSAGAGAGDPRCLPCNVVVADAGEGRTRVEVFDPEVMMGFSAELSEVANDARARLDRMLVALVGEGAA